MRSFLTRYTGRHSKSQLCTFMSSFFDFALCFLFQLPFMNVRRPQDAPLGLSRRRRRPGSALAPPPP